jgi:hypothetical protein
MKGWTLTYLHSLTRNEYEVVFEMFEEYLSQSRR